MKKILSVFLVVMALMVLSSCDSKMSVAYSVAANGDANGVVDVTFPNGDFTSTGTAAISFKWANDTTAFQNAAPVTLEQAKASKDKRIVKAASYVEDWVDDNFNAASASGDYYVHIQGYVTETLTGLKISIDREFTNR